MKADANSKSIIAKSDRYKQLVEIGGVSKQEYDDIKASVAQANADIEIAKAALATAKINLDYTKVLSPIAGRIGKSQFTEGALATQNQEAPLATVQQLDPIYVDVTQSSAELLGLQRQANAQGLAQEMPVTLIVEGDNQPFEQKGKLQFSDASVDETTGSIQMRILFPNPDHKLLPGMFVRARIGQSRSDNAILVPQQAVSRSADGSASVMLVGDGNKVVPQQIKVSDSVGDKWMVLEGLKVGDRVIVEGMKAAPGSVVKPVEQSSSPAPALSSDSLKPVKK
jgi:membrane fusion protein (multidrug efflux system)